MAGDSGAPGPQVPLARPQPATSTLADPPEPWDIPVARRDHRKVSQMFPGRPFRPSKPEDVPPAATASLERACGPLALEQLFVIPRATRLVTPTSCVISPAKVLGFGADVVGLWIDDGPDGRLASIPIESLLAVDNRKILLYGRLRMLAAAGLLTVHYDTVSRLELDQNLATLRAAAAVLGQPFSPGFLWLEPGYPARTPAELPHKWNVVLGNPMVRPHPDEPVAVAVGDVAEAHRDRHRPASGVAILGERELIMATEPSEYLDSDRYGVDLLAVPRQRLHSLGWDGRSLIVRLGSGRSEEGQTAVCLTIDPYLAEAMSCVFGEAVRWS